MHILYVNKFSTPLCCDCVLNPKIVPKGRLKSGLRAINPYWTESHPAASQTNFSYTSKKISFCVL